MRSLAADAIRASLNPNKPLRGLGKSCTQSGVEEVYHMRKGMALLRLSCGTKLLLNVVISHVLQVVGLSVWQKIAGIIKPSRLGLSDV